MRGAISMASESGKEREAGHPQTRDKEATRQRLLDAAEQVFAEKGYHGAGVDDIIRASDSSKGGFYFHFPNKQAIFLALVEAQDHEQSVAESRKLVARRFGISESQLRQIEQEGLNEQWPPL